MKILVLSDLHIPIKADFGSLKNLNFDNYDQIFLLGDIVQFDVLTYLDNQKPILQAVHGNMDDFYIKNKLSEKIELNIYDKKIGLIHGHQTGPAIPERLIKYFKHPLDLMVYGHSHVQEKIKINDTIILNPGAFCDGNYAEITFTKDNIQINLLHI